MKTIRLLAPAAFILASLFTAGCNTTKGMGEDVEATGEAVQDAAQNTEDKMKK